MDTKIILNSVNQYYGKTQALHNVNLTIEAGMFGLLGRNGAGKTTLMKAITTLLPIQQGTITVCGVPIKEASTIRSMVGYLPQEFSMYGNMTAYEAMDYLGVLSGLSKEVRKQRIPTLLKQVNLGKHQKTKVKEMSGGMKRRLGIAQAILHDPKVLIVDEPTAGLDPEERVRFRNLLSEMAENRIVILSTHIVGDIEATCEKIAIMDEGTIVFDGTVTELLKLSNGKVYSANISKMEVEAVKKNYTVTSILTMEGRSEIRFLVPEGMTPFSMAVLATPTVEDAYMYLMQERRREL